MWSLIQRYLLPGLVFQGIVIGGGYATGRELIEFFLPAGPLGGLAAMAIAAAIWSAVMAISFELCRMSGSYDYRHFFQRLLGRAWLLYEVLLVLLLLVVLSVVSAASGEILRNLLGTPPALGTLVLLLIVGVLVFYGSALIERFMGAWSLLLYAAYFTCVVWSLARFGPEISATVREAPNPGNPFIAGIRYAGYNLAAVPMAFFCLTHIRRRREAIAAGLIAGVVGMLPAVFLFVALLAVADRVGAAPIPSAVLLEALGTRWFAVLFQVVLLGTLVQTGVGMLHTINERIARTLEEHGRAMPRGLRPVLAVGLLLLALLLASRLGIVGLIARGYGLLTFGFIAVFVVPVLTVGTWRVLARSRFSPERARALR